MAKIYDDSKTFVDMSLKDTPDNTMKKFNEFMESVNQQPTKDQIKAFVNVSIFFEFLRKFMFIQICAPWTRQIAYQIYFHIFAICIKWLDEKRHPSLVCFVYANFRYRFL